MYHLTIQPSHRPHLPAAIARALHTLRTLSTVAGVLGLVLLAAALTAAAATYEAHDHAYLASLTTVICSLALLLTAGLLRGLSRLDRILAAILSLMADEVSVRRVRRTG